MLKELDASLEHDNGIFPERKPPLSDLPSSEMIARRHPREIATAVIRQAGTTPPEDPQDDDFSHLILADSFKRLSIDPIENRFFGKSSGAMLIQTAIELKNEYTGRNDDIGRPILGSMRPEFWTIRPVRVAASHSC